MNWPTFITEAIIGDEETRKDLMFGDNLDEQKRVHNDLALNKKQISDHSKFIRNALHGTPLAAESIKQLAETAFNHNAAAGFSVAGMAKLPAGVRRNTGGVRTKPGGVRNNGFSSCPAVMSKPPQAVKK